jgi:hypothetical protein
MVAGPGEESDQRLPPSDSLRNLSAGAAAVVPVLEAAPALRRGAVRGDLQRHPGVAEPSSKREPRVARDHAVVNDRLSAVRPAASYKQCVEQDGIHV